DDLHGPLRAEPVEDEVDEAGACGRGGLAPTPVLVLLQRRLDPVTGRGGHVGAAVEHLRDRRHRQAELVRDRRDGGAWPRAGHSVTPFGALVETFSARRYTSARRVRRQTCRDHIVTEAILVQP